MVAILVALERYTPCHHKGIVVSSNLLDVEGNYIANLQSQVSASIKKCRSVISLSIVAKACLASGRTSNVTREGSAKRGQSRVNFNQKLS